MNSAPPQFLIPPQSAMQSVSRHRIRRKGPVPITKKSEDHVWQRTLDALGLEILQTKSSSATPTSVDAMDAPTPSTAVKMRKSIPDLPLEVQRNIFECATSPDLISLSLVSRHFRGMAAEVLYRTFHIVFPDEDDCSNDSSIDGLACGLDTFVTSDYDYAQHLRHITLETLSGGEKGERTYKEYMYSLSCGKFMNTLLLLTLRKTKALETFKWDIRVELSRQVFKALHQIDSLDNLHLRMQAGPSIYQAPPAIGIPPPSLPAGLTFSTINLPPSPPPAPHNGPVQPPGMPPVNSNSYALGYKIAQKLYQNQIKKSVAPSTIAPPTLAGFKNLQTLAILDMDDDEYVDGLKACIEASPNLKSLRLSFSETFANKSRRPPPEIHSDDESDQEDEFGQVIPPPGPIDPNAPTQALKAQEQKKKQDAVLGNILGWQPALPKARIIPLPTTDVKGKETKASDELKDPREQFIRRLGPWAKRIMINIQPGGGHPGEGKEILNLIAEACKAYLDSSKKDKDTEAGGSSAAKGTPASSITSGIDSTPSESGTADGPGLFDEPKNPSKEASDESEVANPDDIDVDEPEDDADFETTTEPASDLSPAEPVSDLNSTEPAPDLAEIDSISDTENHAQKKALLETDILYSAGQLGTVFSEKADDWQARWNSENLDLVSKQTFLASNYEDFKRLEQKLKTSIEKLNAQQLLGIANPKITADIAALNAEWGVIKQNLDLVSRILGTAQEDLENISSEMPASKPGMLEYIRETRGLSLTNLEIYLIPVKPNVISQTIDLRNLQSITLLNVGPQNPLWALMMAHNYQSSLPLKKIYTDNVTVPFLVFLSQLDHLSELIMVERAPKQKVESTAAKTTVSIEQIRKFVLKKHAATLKILVIKNKATAEWDLNVKTAILLCRRAKMLEELGCIYGSKVLHSLLQFLPGMEALRVLHAYQFRDGDNCAWVVDGIRKFTVDVVAHNPQMKLEYIALDQSIDRIVRRKPDAKTASSKKGKGKAKAHNHVLNDVHSNNAMGGIGSVPTWEAAIANGKVDWESSDEEDDDGSFARGLRLETLEGCMFWNIPDVRIFEKDVLTGAL